MENHARAARIFRLLESLPREPGSSIPGPATQEEINDLQSHLGYAVPSDLRDWLAISNGPCVGPGGLFGIGKIRDHLSMIHCLSLYPDWNQQRWIPVAGDGCGNYYVLIASGKYGNGNPVVFVEPINSTEKPTYVVASNFWAFLDGLLGAELSKSTWPFNAEEVIERDPDILLTTGTPLPWE